MPNAINWETSPSLTAYLTTELNSLANGSGVTGAAIDNSTGLDMWADVEVFVHTQGSARAAGAYLGIYLIPAPDGTNYLDDTINPAQNFVASLALDAATTARRVGAFALRVPPGLFKLRVLNATGQAFASTTNTMGYRLYSEELQ